MRNDAPFTKPVMRKSSMNVLKNRMKLCVWMPSRTTESFSEPGVILSSQFLGMLAYDIVLTCMASILFDYLWYEG